MRRMILPLILLAAIACQPATTELTEEQQAEITEELTALYPQGAAAITALDREGWLAYFDNNDELTAAVNGTIWRSWSALADTIAAHWAGYASLDFEWGDLIVQVLAPNAAVVTTTMDFTGTDLGGSPMAGTGTWTAVWVKKDGQWKMVNISETFPPAEAAPEEA